MRTEVPNTIFIIGAARSGTTLLYETLCNHKQIGYITDRMDYEHHEKLLKKSYDIARILILKMRGKYHKLWRPTIRYDSAPNEGNAFWLMYLPNWKYMIEKDVSAIMQNYFRSQVLSIIRKQGKRVFLNKNPHHSYRVRLLNAIFPDCKFIHIIRDGRAVAYSELVRRSEEWDDKPIIENILRVHFRPERSYLYNIGQEWQCMVTFAREAAMFGPERYFELKYEDLIHNRENISKILEFCNLDSSYDFMQRVPEMRNENVKWRTMLDDKLLMDIEESTYELRKELGYS